MTNFHVLLKTSMVKSTWNIVFVDAFSNYNQIKMHSADVEKIGFIINEGRCYYKVMSFMLKEINAYERMIHEIFKDKIGKNVKVGIVIT